MSAIISQDLPALLEQLDIPFNREQFADYLNVDRTALSKELSNMQSEGLIEFKKNHFKLLELDHEELT